MKNFFLIFILFFQTFSAQNQWDNLWFMYFGNQQISPKINWWTEAQFRNEDFIKNPQQIFIRTGVGYQLNEKNNLLLGYGFFSNYSQDEEKNIKKSSTEHRIYQQFINKHQWGKTAVQHRFRTEQRWIENENMKFRARYFLGLNIPFSGNFMQKNSTYISAYNEVFLIPEKSVIERNRLYLALGYVLNKNTRFELGYLVQSVKNQGNHIFSSPQNQGQIQLAIFNTINF